MPLESCMILLDRSQYMRNGDYIPTRLEAQRDAANLLITAKTNSHPESTVGISAGTELLVSPTEDVGKILAAVHGVKLVPADPSITTTEKQSSASEDADVIASVSVASLALKHRRNKNGAQRIVIFIGTPVHADAKTLQKTGRNLKKNNVHIDVILLGEIEHNEPLLQELVDAANGTSSSANNTNNNNNDANERTCHLVAVPPGVLPSDVLASSPILGAAGAMMGMMMGASNVEDAFGGTGAMDFIGGVDPNMDPELAMALRVSMEEERARQERAAAAAAAAAASTTETTQSAPSPMLDEEEALLQQALAMSMNENEPKTSTDDDEKQDEAQDMEMDEDAAMQMALQMSMQQQESEQDTSSSTNQQIQDPEFVQQILQGMPGVDPNDPEIQEMLRKAAEEKKKQGDQDQDKK